MKEQMAIHNSNRLPFFEGFYFKVTTDDIALAIVVGFSLEKNNSTAFIQCYNTKTFKMDYLEYEYKDFYFDLLSETVYIKDSYFGEDEVYLFDDRLDYTIHYHMTNCLKLDSNIYSPTIMGPFYYLPFMQCNHAIITLKSSVSGTMKFNEEIVNIEGIGYVEKDWGNSFPSEYIWLQSNHSSNSNANLFLACANIPLVVSEFIGVIGVFIVEGKTYRIGTYYGAKLIERSMIDDLCSVVIKQGKYVFSFKIRNGTTFELKGPNNGLMTTRINESLDSRCLLKVYRKGVLKHEVNFIKCGSEIIDFMK